MKKILFPAVILLTLHLSACQNSDPSAALNEQETADLRFLREEEKMAYDVYTYAYQLYGIPVFNNISGSEQRHMNSVLYLLDKYGIPDPVSGQAPGEFSDPGLQSMYDQLIARVKISLPEALRAGATIEDVDLYDIQNLLSHTNRSDLVTVYNNLACGSKNHLRSFVGQLGGDYTPAYITQTEFDDIIAGTNGPCGGN